MPESAMNIFSNHLAVKDKRLPYWRLSNVYFSNCLLLGLVLPFWGLYLSFIGLNSREIGMSSALLLASNMVAPFFWKRLQQKSRSALQVIRFGLTVALIISPTLLLVDGFIGTSVFIFLLSFCWQGIHPIVESLTMSHLGKLSHYYGQIRLWGSIGFVVAVSGFGLLFDTISIAYFPYVLLGCMLFLAISSVFVPSKVNLQDKDSSVNSTLASLKESGCIGLFLAVFLVQISQGAYVGFFSIYLEQNGIAMLNVGNLWAVAVLAEVTMFLFIHRIISKIGADSLLIISLLLTSIRWIAIAVWVDLLPILFIAQLLHAFTYGGMHSAVMELIRQQFNGKDQSNGIILYSTFCLGAGTAIGAIFSGYFWTVGSFETFLISALFALASVFIALVWKNKLSVPCHRTATNSG